MTNPWILAARPRTLPAAIAPVVLGSATAWAAGGFRPLPALLCLAFAVLVQIAANLANDYFDGVKGTDTADRLGPPRMVASGRLAAPAMWRATGATLALAFAVGCGLIPFGGWWLLGIGSLCLLCALAYTGGPYPLGYHGWGDVFVFVFFGLVATTLTYFVQVGDLRVPGQGVFIESDVCTFMVRRGDFNLALWLVAIVPGALSVNLLAVNNLRDRESDAPAGKRTLAVRLGRRFVLGEFLAMGGLAFGVTLALPFLGFSYLVLLPWLLLGWFATLFFRLTRARHREQWQAVLSGTGQFLFAFSVLLAIGLASSPVLSPANYRSLPPPPEAPL